MSKAIKSWQALSINILKKKYLPTHQNPPYCLPLNNVLKFIHQVLRGSPHQVFSRKPAKARGRRARLMAPEMMSGTWYP